jgi:hypothetical protein
MVTQAATTQGRLDIRAAWSRILPDTGHCCDSVRLPLPAPVEAQARQRLLEDCPYAYYFQRLSFQFAGGVLTVRGRVPTFYLKQLVQSRLRSLDGVKEIDNQVNVVSATGLSSEPRNGSGSE